MINYNIEEEFLKFFKPGTILKMKPGKYIPFIEDYYAISTYRIKYEKVVISIINASYKVCITGIGTRKQKELMLVFSKVLIGERLYHIKSYFNFGSLSDYFEIM